MYITNKRKIPIRYKFLAGALFIFLGIFLSVWYIDQEIMPNVQILGDLKAQEMLTQAVSQGVRRVLDEEIQYDDLISIREDGDGNVTMLQANAIYMNRIASDAALTIQEELNHVHYLTEKVPLGNIWNSPLLARYGPKIKLKMEPVGVVKLSFGSEFDQAGINQTRHRIFLVITTRVRVVIPMSTSDITNVAHVPLAETVIVGKVPLNYIQIPENEVLNIAPLVGE